MSNSEDAEQELEKLRYGYEIMENLVHARELLFNSQRKRGREYRRRIAELETIQDRLIDAALLRDSSSKGPMFVRCAECGWALINGTNIRHDKLGHAPRCSIASLLTTERAQAKFDAWKPYDWSKHDESTPGAVSSDTS